MPDEIKAPYYSYEDLRREADKFLGEYHPAGTIPVPIEQIVEFQFRVDIVPTPGLHQLLETDGFITSDLREIWVDQFVYDSLEHLAEMLRPHVVTLRRENRCSSLRNDELENRTQGLPRRKPSGN